MPPRDTGVFMWAEACELLERAERLQRRFFVPVARQARRPVWEPPVDVLETEREVWILAALPGVAREKLEVVVDSGILVVAGERRLPAEVHPAHIHRLEIPQGRFERRVVLPSGRYEIGRSDLVDGLLVLTLRKLA